MAEITAEIPGAVLSGVAADLTDLRLALKPLVAATPDADILVNNLGLIDLKPFQDLTDEDWMCASSSRT